MQFCETTGYRWVKGKEGLMCIALYYELLISKTFRIQRPIRPKNNAFVTA